jgi:acetyl-CoA acyltransferase 1
MFAYCVENLGLDVEKVNVNGGAMYVSNLLSSLPACAATVILTPTITFPGLFFHSALGHPLGCSGVRQVVTGLAELKRRGGEGQVLCTSMCVGAG